MYWYLRLFGPVIAGVGFLAFLILMISLDIDPGREGGQMLGTMAVGIGTWGLLQTLFFPARAYKKRHRRVILITFGVYPLFLLHAFWSGDPPEAWLLVLAPAALVLTVLFALRFRPSPYSLAPGWQQVHYLSGMAVFGGWTLFLLFLLDEVYIRELRLTRWLPVQQFAVFFLIPWGLAHGVALISYYAENILHYRRNSLQRWQSQIDRLG